MKGNNEKDRSYGMSCLFLPHHAHDLLGQPGFLRAGGVSVGVRVLQCQEGVGSDGALARGAATARQVGGGERRDGGSVAGGGERLQLLEVLLLLLLLLHQLVEQHLLLLR